MAVSNNTNAVQDRADSSSPGISDDSPWRLRFEAIHRQLRERIALLHYPPATRLDVDALAAEFGVSRTPIRTVLHQLEREGLAVTRHGVGTTVTDIDRKHLREATMLRMHLAELIGVLDPKPLTDELAQNLSQLKQECDNLLEGADFEQFARIDIELHECICSIIGNSQLKITYDKLYYGCARMWFYFLPHMDWRTEVSALSTHIDMIMWAASRNDAMAVGSAVSNAIFQGLYRLGVLIAPGDEA